MSSDKTNAARQRRFREKRKRNGAVTGADLRHPLAPDGCTCVYWDVAGWPSPTVREIDHSCTYPHMKG